MKNILTPRNNRRLSPGDLNLAVVIHFTALVGFAGHLLFIFLFCWLGITLNHSCINRVDQAMVQGKVCGKTCVMVAE
ncbi:MAG: hypothetical protein NT121_20980 [Chloroflexi bacterium]|nr:hypothetical protein [Chloroflexota bacterium]